MYCVRGPSVLYDLRASSLDPRTIRLPLVLWQGASEHARVLSLSIAPLGVDRPTCRSGVALVTAVADAPLAIDTFNIRQVTATRQISPTNIHQISLRSVETCSPTGSQPIQHLWSAQTSPLGPTPVTSPRKLGLHPRDNKDSKWPKELNTPFLKMDHRDMDIIYIKAEWWFRMKGIQDHRKMVAYTSQFLEGSTCEWWKSKLTGNKTQLKAKSHLASDKNWQNSMPVLDFKLHGHKFVLAKQLLQAAAKDRPIGFMLLDLPTSLLLAFGFVPTGHDK
ncbi:uncharacterized protein MEPE_06845 [Melanopsichium pennsylvanicum]|uniref:Retrotransposon gag domain-containing protein n=1 Tax=Melanopsichium pennsylvanicum TaxID=63383 RepID=A0AAJ4XRW4_9BASI|nr:uncharacterized protein MEPE_06845 [Melanopsichium pennsylvanicum]